MPLPTPQVIGPTRRCPNDHPVTTQGMFCPECGAELIDLAEELDRRAEEGKPSWFGRLLAAHAQRAPWWIISFLVHVSALIAMRQWPYRLLAEEEAYTNVAVDLAKELEPEEVEPPEEEEREIEEDLDVPIKDIPIRPVTPTMREPGPDVDLPFGEDALLDDLRPLPTIDPPSNTLVLAVETSRKSYSRGIYSGRNSRGRARAIGGRGGTSASAESAVNAGLRWLAKAQERDGSWSSRRWGGSGEYRVGMTGLALLAFLGAGFTHRKGRYKTTVVRGLTWLAANQKPNGQFGYRTFYEQGIAAMAVGEAYGLTRSPKLGRMAQRATDFIVKIQPAHGGFRYGGAVPRGDGDMSVTGWQIMAIKSAICSELTVPEQAVHRFRAFLKNSYRGYGKSAYVVGRKGPGSVCIWSIGMLCRQFLGGDYDIDIRHAADALLRHAKVGKGQDKLVGDLYYTYYSVLSMYQMGGQWWVKWNRLFRDPLVRAQVRKRYDQRRRYVRGSWEPANHHWARRGGRVYATAMAILSLEVYYRFLPVYRH